MGNTALQANPKLLHSRLPSNRETADTPPCDDFSPRITRSPVQCEQARGLAEADSGLEPVLAKPPSIVVRYTTTRKGALGVAEPQTVEVQIPRDDWDAFLKECMESLRGLITRDANAQRLRIKFADLELHLLKRTAIRGNRALHLSKKEFDLLEYFVRRPRRVLTRDQIFEHVWGFNEEEHSNTVEVHLSSLRRKLNETSSKPLIQTVRGVGYMLSEEKV